METFFILGLVLVAVFLISVINSKSTEKKKVFKDNTYSYTAKSSLMTRTEAEFFVKLNRIVSDRYFVFPQVHLSAVFEHRIKGQEWKYAFRHINGKSVDYVLCDKETLRPTYAIEIDDYTHNQIDRRTRDTEVERIFNEANLPLIRINNKAVSQVEIIRKLEEANKQVSSR